MKHSMNRTQMGRRGNGYPLLIAGGILLTCALLGGILFILYKGMSSPPAQLTIVGNGGGAQEAQTSGNNCGTSRTSTITFTQQNGLNTTGNEGIDSTCYIYKVSGTTETYVATQTDTTAGTLSADCNQLYHMYCTSTDANGGDSGKVLSIAGDGLKVISKTDDKGRTVEGAGIEFLTNAPTYSVTWKGKQHATLQFRTFDVENNNYMYNEEDSTTSDYETDGVNFTSTSGNTTALAVGSGGTVHVIQEIQATDVDTDFSDVGFYIGVKASRATWDPNSVSASFTNDAKVTTGLSSSKGSLDAGEDILFDTAYQYVYFVPDSLKQKTSKFELELKAISGINPGTSDDIEIDYISKGAVLRTAGESSGVRFSASTDASSPAAIYAVQDTNIAVS